MEITVLFVFKILMGCCNFPLFRVLHYCGSASPEGLRLFLFIFLCSLSLSPFNIGSSFSPAPPVYIKTWPVEQSSHLLFFKTTASIATSPVGNTFTSENALSSFNAGERNPWLCRALHLLVGRCNALLPGLSTIYNRQFKYDNFCVKLCGARPLGILHRVASCVTKSCYEHAVECYRELLWASLLGVTESCYGQVC
jgi:hypothetical protein